MPRVLSEKPCELKIRDAISGGVITLFYTRPDHARRMKFFVSLYTRVGEKIIVNSAEYLAAGTDILTGIADGDFLLEDGTPLSSDPNSKHYNPDWKKHITEMAPDLVAELGRYIFEGLNVVTDLAKSQVVLEEKSLPLESGSSDS